MKATKTNRKILLRKTLTNNIIENGFNQKTFREIKLHINIQIRNQIQWEISTQIRRRLSE